MSERLTQDELLALRPSLEAQVRLLAGDEAEDIVAAVLAGLVLDGTAVTASYVRKRVQWRALDWCRARGRSAMVADEIVSTVATPDDRYDVDSAEIAGLLARLTERQRSVVLARADGQSRQEIANDSGLSTGGVARVLGRVRYRLGVPARVTPRQHEVLVGLADGLTRRAIGQRLQIGSETVKRHCADLYRALQVPNEAAAVAAGFRQGLLT